jgi:hypothetical protein
MIINNRYEEPYNKFPKDGPIPLLSKPVIISKLSKKFWLYTQYIKNENLLNKEEEEENEEKDNNINNNNNYYNNYNNYEIANLNNQFQGNPNFNIKNNINAKINPKSNNYRKKNNNFENEKNIYEINELNEIILRLQNELYKQDYIINNQINEKKKLIKRIHELEQVLKNFC